MPQVVFIWDTVLMTLKSVLVHMKSVKTVEWCPVRNICLIGTASGRVYIWSEDGALLCDLPFGNGYLEKMFKVESVEWSLDGQYFLAKDRLELVVAYPNLDEICQ
jgi:WD40 repeat protein